MINSPKNWNSEQRLKVTALIQHAKEKQAHNLIAELKKSVETVNNGEQLWELHNTLSYQRKVFDKKFNNANNVLLLLGRLLADDLIQEEALDFLPEDNCTEIVDYASMWRDE